MSIDHREAIARIIDPQVWERMDRALIQVETIYDDPREKANAISDLKGNLNQSLAKADAIGSIIMQHRTGLKYPGEKFWSGLQPRSNSVEDGAGRNSIQIESSSDTASVPLSPLIEDAINDAYSGWRYIRKHHGDLYGVDWDRVETKLKTAAQSIEQWNIRSAPVFKAAHKSGESDPTATLDCAGADTPKATDKPLPATEQSGHVPSQVSKGI